VTVDRLNAQSHTPIDRSIIPENFMTLSFTVFEKTAGQNDFLKTENRPYLPTGSGISKKKKKKKKPNLVHLITHLPRKFHKNLSSHF
jgi:hypothetical protein